MSTNSLHAFLTQRLDTRKQGGLYREPGQKKGSIDFASNDYLGLARSAVLSKQIHEKTLEASPSHGSTGSRLLTGNTPYTELVEGKLASLFKAEACLLFNAGYTANLAVISSLPQKDDTIIYDELAHACIKDGARLSLARRFSFRHNDLEDLKKKIARASGRIFVVVESVYSMDGDEAPLNGLIDLAQQYDLNLIIDEAHSTGVIGPQGSGLAVSLGLEAHITARIYTFGKAMGIHGACVAGSVALIAYLINFARPFIYTTAPPPHAVASVEKAFDYLHDHIGLQQDLYDRIALFKAHAPSGLAYTESHSAIQTAVFPGNAHVKKIATILQQQGFDIRPILSPTVPAGSERLRICLHAFNTPAEIAALTQALGKL